MYRAENVARAFPAPGPRNIIRALRRATTDMALNVKDFGAVGDGTTNDTVAIQAALNAVPTAGAVVFFPAGDYLVPNGGLTCSRPVHIQGVPGLDGTGSRIRVTADAVTGLALSGSGSVIEHISISHPITGTRSPGLVGLIISNANFSRMDNCRVDGFSTNVKVTSGIYYSILNSSFRDFVLVGLDYTNLLAGGDAGDGTIQNCTFDRGSDTISGGTCLLWHSGGGMRFINNKINGKPGGGYFEHGVRLTMDPGIGTSVLLIGNNSIENFTGIGVSLLESATSSFFNTIVVTGNEISGLDATADSTGIFLDEDTSGVVITGNHIFTVATGIDLQRVKHVAISGNSLSNIKTTGVRVRNLCRDVIIERQPIDMLTAGADIVFDNAPQVVDPYYEKSIPFGSGASGMAAITDAAVHDLLEVAVSLYSNVIVDIDITAVSQNAGTWVFRGARMIAGNGTGEDLAQATIGTDYVFQGTVAQVVVTTTGLGGVFRLGVQKLSGDSMSGHMRVKVRGSGMTTVKQLVRYN